MPSNKKIKVFLASDHAGFEFKEKVKRLLDKKRISYFDFSPDYLPKDDYPDYAFKVSQRVARNSDYRGILVCCSGVGMAIAANKVKGARAVAAYDVFTAKKSREHNDSNILCLRARKFSSRKNKKIILVWLSTDFSNEERHKRRIKKIDSFSK